MNYCPFCGNRLNNNPVTCGGCGNSLLEAYRLLNEQPNTGGNVNSSQNNNASMDSFYKVADLRHQKKDYAGELDWLRRAEPQYPNDEELKLRIGKVCRIMGKNDDAILSYKEAIRINPKNPVTYNNLAAIYVAKNDNVRALDTIKKAYKLIEDDPSSAPQNQRATIYAGYARCIGMNGDKQSARRLLEKARREGYNPAGIAQIEKAVGLK